MKEFRKPTYAVWIIGLVLVSIAFIASYLGFVRTVTGQTMDDNAMVAASEFLAADATRRTAIGFLSRLPEISVGIAILAGLIAGIVRRTIVSPAIALGSALAAATTTQFLKMVLDRPDLGVSAAKGNSFPSGHTTLAAAAIVAVVLLVAPKWRPLVATLGGVFTALAGAATYVLGWHRPADIIGAYLVAAFFGLIGGLLILKAEPGWNMWDADNAPSGLWLAFPWVPGVVGVATTLGIYVLVLRGHEAETGDALLGWTLAAGLSFITGVAMMVMGAASSLLSWDTRPEREAR